MSYRTTADGETLHNLSPDESRAMISVRRRISARLPLRDCGHRFGDDRCPGKLFGWDLDPDNPENYPVDYVKRGRGEFDRARIEARCDTCRYVVLFWLVRYAEDGDE